jgi:succinate-acetate transporter protein
MFSASMICAAMFPASMLSVWMHLISILSASLPADLSTRIRTASNFESTAARLTDWGVWCFRCASMFVVALLGAQLADSSILVLSLRFDVFRCAPGCTACGLEHFGAFVALLAAQSGWLLEPSSLRGEQRAHSLLGICQSRFIVFAVQHVPFRRLSFARPLRFVHSS